MLVSKSDFFGSLSNRTLDPKVQITKHRNGLYSVCLTNDFGVCYELKNSREPKTIRLFKTVEPIFKMLEAHGDGAYDIFYFIQTQD